MSKTTNKFSPEVRTRAVRMVLEHGGDYPSRWAAVVSVSQKIGCSAHTLNDWVKKAEVDGGRRAGVPSEVAEKLKALERENRELRQANEILRKASACFAQADHRGRRVRHPRMGRLVQQQAPARAHRQHPAGRSRGKSLRRTGTNSHGRIT